MAMFPTNRGFVFFSRVAVAVAFSASILAISGCGHEPFGYVKVQGKIHYEDGTLIPASRIVVRFISQAPTPDRKITARPGDAEVNVKTGAFTNVTSHAFGDGIVPGEHKVVIVGAGDTVPEEYTKVETTPLTVNSKDSPFDLKIAKPTGK